MEIGDTGESRDPWDTGVSWGHKGHNGTHETQGDTRDIRDTGDTKEHMGRR